MKTLKEIDKTLLQDKIDYIFDNFNFSRVASVMQFANWKYAISEDGTSNYNYEIPDEPYLRKTARKHLKSMLTSCENEHRGSVTSGGFEWSFEIFEDDEICLKLAFIFEELDD